MTSDTSQVTMFFNGIMRIFLKAPITCIGSIILATILNPRLSLIIYGVVALIAVLTIISMKMSYIRFAKLQIAFDRANSVIQEYLLGIRLVKAFGTYEEEERRFGEANEDLRQRAVSTQMIITITSPIMALIVGFGTVLAVYFGHVLFGRELIEPGDIAAFIAYMTQMLMSLMMIIQIFHTLERARASAARIGEVLDCEEDFSGTVKEVGVPLCGSLAFDNVTFSYPGSPTPAVKNLSFAISPGETLAVIGPTGSGKTTVCWLILRFFDPDEGHISLGGHDIRELPIATVRGNIAIAPQKPLLFSDTVAGNIRWGQAEATDECIHMIAEKAQAAHFIQNMPDGYDSVLGRGGVNISGGQKQRLSIARALIKNAPLLIIDDATSALDAMTEASMRAELAQYHGTKVIITQRCVAAMSADAILVMDNGRAVGFGSHGELMESCQTYVEIWQSQIGAV
jgi:ATP-binding cassette subfamily B protein